MNLETLKEELKKDSLIDSTELAKEALRTPAIHGKYLSLQVVVNLIIKLIFGIL
jgi:hypothetical protein